MKKIILAIYLALAILFILAAFSGCTKPAEKNLNSSLNYTSFRDCPGITDDEIKAIAAIREQRDSLIYGTTPTTEAFYAVNDEIKGYTALLCQWLTEFFDIPFIPAIYTWGDLMKGLETNEIDFTGELTASDERRKIWFMTDAIAERSIKVFRIKGSIPLSEIAPSRPLRYAFLGGTTTVDTVISTLTPGTFETFFIDDSYLAHDLLKSGQADAFFNEGPGEASFDIYTDVVARDFFPPVYEPVSMSTRNPALEPIISVIQKMLRSGGIRYLTELYNEGYRDYTIHKLHARLTHEERAYILNSLSVPVLAEYDNYPLSFYNVQEKAWQGAAIDALDEVAALTGLSFKIVNDHHADGPALLNMLEDGKASMITELIPSSDRVGRFLWPMNAIMTDYYSLISKSDHRNININEILFVKIGLVKDTMYTALFQSWFPNYLNTVEYDNSEAAFYALEHDEVDMVMSSLKHLLSLTNYRELAGYKANVIFNNTFDSPFGFNKNEHTLCSIVDKALALVDTTGISESWMRKTYDYREKLVRSRIPWLIGGSILLLCVLILLSVLFRRKRNEGKRLEEQVQKRTAELERQHELMSVVNETAKVLLDSGAGDYFSAIIETIKMICRTVEVDHVYLWQNQRKDNGKLCYKQVCKWIREGMVDDYSLLVFSYEETLPSWENLLAEGKSVTGLLDSFPEIERRHLAAYNVQSVLAVPIFVNDAFWGFVSFDNVNNQKVYDEAEENVLQSWGLLAVGAIERGRIALKMQNTLTKMEAIISNYNGIIWSIDNERIITNFNGQYLKTIGIDSSSVEGKKLENTRLKENYLQTDVVEKTFRNGPQDWISDIDDKVLHSFTTPLFDKTGKILGIVGSTNDVTEMIRLQRDLSTAVEAAQAASVSKSRFLANMSHEMRTPLNAIIGFSEMELNTADLTEDSIINIERIYSAGVNLLGIINDILDISKIESGKFTLTPIVYDVPSMINDTINLNMVRIGSKPIQFSLHIDGTVPSKLEGDELRLKQIFNNLLSNAIKYTDTGSVDWFISTVREGNRVKVTSTVKDTGKGISEEDQKKLFSDYFQTDLKANYHVEGTGLGLSITLNMIKLMGGTIKVESEFRKGSAFTVEFYQETVGDEVIGDELAATLSQFRYAIQRRSENKKLARADMSYAAVLVVDDVVTNLDVARGILKPYKMTVECAKSGQEAINRVREEKVRYDAIFMDHMMPGMDGIEAVRIIRNEIGTEYAKTVPIIALTANAVVGNDALFLGNGFQAFLSKPIDIQRLDQILRQWVRNREKESSIKMKTVETEVKETTSSKTLTIPGINIENTLPRFNNDQEFYLRVLTSFVNNTPVIIENIKKTFNNLSPAENLDIYQIAVHSLKGSSRGVGADELGNIAEKLEKAVKQKDTAYIEANTVPFIEAAEVLIATLADFLAEASVNKATSSTEDASSTEGAASGA
jgi:PAS domain S-box-containing protein